MKDMKPIEGVVSLSPPPLSVSLIAISLSVSQFLSARKVCLWLVSGACAFTALVLPPPSPLPPPRAPWHCLCALSVYALSVATRNEEEEEEEE